MDNSKLIAEFMGGCVKFDKSLYSFPGVAGINNGDLWFTLKQAKFNADYNWIILVVDRIESLGYISTIEKLSGGGMYRVFFNEDNTLIANGSRSFSRLEAIHDACVNFIKWYNKKVKNERV